MAWKESTIVYEHVLDSVQTFPEGQQKPLPQSVGKPAGQLEWEAGRHDVTLSLIWQTSLFAQQNLK